MSSFSLTDILGSSSEAKITSASDLGKVANQILVHKDIIQDDVYSAVLSFAKDLQLKILQKEIIAPDDTIELLQRVINTSIVVREDLVSIKNKTTTEKLQFYDIITNLAKNCLALVTFLKTSAAIIIAFAQVHQLN